MYEPLCVIPTGGRDFFLVGVGYEPQHKKLHPIPMKHLCLAKQCGLFGGGELAAVDGCDVCRMEATEGFMDGLLAKLGAARYKKNVLYGSFAIYLYVRIDKRNLILENHLKYNSGITSVLLVDNFIFC